MGSRAAPGRTSRQGLSGRGGFDRGCRSEPTLRQLYPFTSHFRLCFSSRASHPWSVRAPSIEPLRDGRFRVLHPRSPEVIGVTDTADAAVALAVANLPAGLGPAVDSVEEGARDQ
ncbi:DUF6193 family natural product biosynthesis protein [Nonomuraea phyllanthi]|uniref:DUF6193 family natural product biosynthesis protein n=1 Tax=Nonomuraea phyllanthi TaxID=2219224 RepID=UPI001D00E56C